VLLLTSYFDDSGSDQLSPITAIGDPTMSKEHFVDFDREWQKILYQYRIPSPLHMTDFVRPYGKHIGMRYEMKLALFSALVAAVNKHKLWSVSVAIPQSEFQFSMTADVRKELIGPYAFAFFCSVMFSQGVAKKTMRDELVISYLIDEGSSFPDQLTSAHSVLVEKERREGGFRHTGAMAFDTDDRVSALQAADLISWSARRRQIDGSLSDEFSVLEGVFDETSMEPSATQWRGKHAHIFIPEEGIEMWAKPIRNWIYVTGKIPSLAEFMR